MKVVLDTSKNRKLVAVVGVDGVGLFVENSEGETVYVETGTTERFSLEELLRFEKNRKPVYEGDTITITF